MEHLQHLLSRNPLYTVLSLVEKVECDPGIGLERTYTLGKSNKVLKAFKAEPGINKDLRRLDHVQILDLYPDCEYIFGPYVDADKDEFGLVYALFTNRVNDSNQIYVLYAGRVLQEMEAGCRLAYHPSMSQYHLYRDRLQSMQELPGRLSTHCYYRNHVFSAQEKAQLLEYYGARLVTQPRYNTLRENFTMTVTLNDGALVQVNPYRALYEIHHLRGRLGADDIVSPVNGKKADLRPDNVMVRSRVNEDEHKRKEALEVYGLDTYALERIYTSVGFDRFRGIYRYEGSKVQNGLKGRVYVKLVKDGTDEQFTLLLSRALVTVQENRVLSINETVDHIDHDSQNDRPENLRLLGRSTHIAQDSVRVEIDPVQCCICNKTFHLSSKAFYYYKNYPSPITCTPRCKKKLRVQDKSTRDALVNPQAITYRYYVLDKVTKKPRYFDSQDYRECKRLLTTETRFHRTEE